MNIPTLSLSDFIKTITSTAQKNNDQENIKKISIKLKLKRIRQRIKEQKSNINLDGHVEIDNDYNFILNTIKNLIPETKEENHYNILILTRLAFHLKFKNDINTDAIIKKYLKWRSNEGKSYTTVIRQNSSKSTNIDVYILKPITKINSKDFFCDWYCAKTPLSASRNKEKTKRDINEIYGTNNVNNVVSCLAEAVLNKTIFDLEKNPNKESKPYIYYKNKENLYNDMKSNYNLTPSESTFYGISSHFVQIKHRGR
ncbi:hypothetical protein [Comamonas thiooxydans]|uniref:hypothetical protein n=1 Tax=Comamonas thiooxydans TaxID=363952 RepID=UPI00118551F6|nr:hypothetical protein [Comamonas thiooxydans]